MPTSPAKKSSEPFVERWKESLAKNRLPSALLFVGAPGSGLEEATVEICRTLLGRSENHPDLIRIQPEKNTIKIESIRELIHRLSLKPFESERMAIVIEEADKMTEASANALLKTLEEPPSYVLFILQSGAPEKLLPT